MRIASHRTQEFLSLYLGAVDYICEYYFSIFKVNIERVIISVTSACLHAGWTISCEANTSLLRFESLGISNVGVHSIFPADCPL